MADEINVLVSLQAVEQLLKTTCFTIIWDAAADIGSHHSSAVQMSSPTEVFTLSIARLPVGTANDYSKHIFKTFILLLLKL